jgi:hypothetical protein
MARRRSEAASILNFFRTANAETATLMFGMVKDVMRERQPKKEPTAAKTPRAAKKKTPAVATDAPAEPVAD